MEVRKLSEMPTPRLSLRRWTVLETLAADEALFVPHEEAGRTTCANSAQSYNTEERRYHTRKDEGGTWIWWTPA